MTARILSRAMLLAFLSAFIGSAAQAAVVRFEVPVAFYNLDPKITQLGVWCLAETRTAQTLGQRKVFFPIPSSGNFSGMILVNVELNQGVELQDVKRYDCRLMRTPELTLWDCARSGPKFREECRVKPGTPPCSHLTKGKRCFRFIETGEMPK